MTTDVLKNHKVNHVALVVDKSGSMEKHEATVIRVVDEFVKGLKEESDNLGHETRISLYAFDHEVKCLVWDMDVKALPSLRGVYRVDRGATSLIEATVLSLEDLKNEVSEKYGEHSFLQVTWTDGEENASGCSETGSMHTSPYGGVKDRAQLNKWVNRIQKVMSDLPDHWTSAILVPSSLAKRTAQGYGFPSGNISVWDADTTKGVEEAIGTMKAAATSFLRSRDQGVRGTKNLFAVGADLDVSAAKAALVPLEADKFRLLKVDEEITTRAFIDSQPGLEYKNGRLFYQLGSRTLVQRQKEIVVVEKATDRAYTGDAARQLLFGTDIDGTVSVKAGHNPALEIYVQSTSPTRKLKPKTRCLFMVK